jgi:RNA polymerase sigma-70 factor (ECF subfamily)
MTNEGARQAPTTVNGGNFDEVVMPHLEAAHRLARWLMRNDHDAEDVVQEASLRAFRYFRTFTGGNGRAWFLRIVRNTCRGHRGRAAKALTESFDEEQHGSAHPASDPEALALQALGVTLVGRALNQLPERFRQLLVHREVEGLSYRELAEVLGIPMGTVMSSLSRARQALRAALEHERQHAGAPGTATIRQDVAHQLLMRDVTSDDRVEPRPALPRDRRPRAPAVRIRARRGRCHVRRLDPAVHETTDGARECAALC